MIRKLVALDIETKSKTADKDDALNPFKNEITCIGVVSKGFAKVYRAPWDSFLKEIYHNNSLCFVAHNGKFDFKHLHFHLGEMPNRNERYVHDTRFAAYTCTEKIPENWLAEYETIRAEENKKLPRGFEHRKAGQHSLKTLAPYFLGVAAFWENPAEHDSDEYVLKDCEYTYKLHMFMQSKLRELGQYKFYRKKLMAWSKVILNAEIEGVVLDTNTVVSLQHTYTERLKELGGELANKWQPYYEEYKSKVLSELEEQYVEMYSLAVSKKPHQAEQLKVKYINLYEKAKKRAIDSGATKLNLDSPSQLQWLLRDQLGLDITNLHGEESTDKEVLNKLARENDEVKLLLENRKLTKLTTAFFPKYLELQHKGKIHTDFNIDGTRTGRLSSSKPNLQQHPSDLKELFISPMGGRFVTYDVTAIEPLLMAYYSEDTALTKLIQEGKSLHSVNAKIMFDLECEEREVKDLHPKERKIAKVIGLAILYGAGWRQVQLACQKEGIFFTQAQCKATVDRIRGSYAGVWDFKKALDAEMEQGSVIFNLLGRPIQFTNPDDIYMKAFNTLVQGSASDLVLDIGSKIAKLPGATPVLFVHDSIVTQVPAEAAVELDREIKNLFSRKLTNSSTTFVLSVDGGLDDKWA